MQKNIPNEEQATAVDFNQVFGDLDVNLGADENAELNKDYGELASITGEYLVMLDRSALPLEQKVYFQAAILEGYLDDELLKEMVTKINTANEALAERVKVLEKGVTDGNSELQQMAEEYAESAKAARHFKEALRQALIRKVEHDVEALGKTSEAEAIAALQSELKSKPKKDGK